MKLISIPALALLLAVLLSGGCRRKKVDTATPAASAPAATSAASAIPDPSPVAGPASRRVEPPPVVYQVDAGVLQALTKFFNDHKRPAMSWEDLVGGKYIPAIPLGPDGKPLDWNTTMQRIGKLSARPRQ